MSVSPADAAIELLARRKARKGLIEFTKYTKPNFKVSPHHIKIAEALEAVERGEIKRLLIEAPRRHGKSELTSRRFPPWYLARNPEKQIINVSYGDDPATDLGRDVRNIISSAPFKLLTGKEPFHQMELRQDSQAAGRFHTTNGGIYSAIGIGGPATGRGANVLLVDDAHKNMDEASNVNLQEKTYEYYTQTLLPTLMPDGAVIIIGSAWCKGDLGDRVLADDTWTVLRFPALAEANDILGRLEGEPLAPLWMTKEFLLSQRKSMGEKAFEAEFQQNRAQKIEGALWTREMIDDYRVDNHPELTRIVVALDPSVTSNADSDECGIVACGLGVDGHGYVLEDASGVFDPHTWAKRAVSLYDKHQANEIVGEVNNGGDLVELNIKTIEPNLKFVKVHASRGKLRRAEPIANLYTQGKIHHVGRFKKLEDQMCSYSGIEGQTSPDRMDGLVWALFRLFVEKKSNILAG